MKISIKLILAALLLGCLANVPYGYFQFIRLASFAGFAYLAYQEFEHKRPVTGLLSVSVALLLNPIKKVHFVRETWNQIDVIIAVALIIWAIMDLVYLYHGKSKEGNEA